MSVADKKPITVAHRGVRPATGPQLTPRLEARARISNETGSWRGHSCRRSSALRLHTLARSSAACFHVPDARLAKGGRRGLRRGCAYVPNTKPAPSPPKWIASGIIAAATHVSMAPAASPSAT